MCPWLECFVKSDCERSVVSYFHMTINKYAEGPLFVSSLSLSVKKIDKIMRILLNYNLSLHIVRESDWAEKHRPSNLFGRRPNIHRSNVNDVAGPGSTQAQWAQDKYFGGPYLGHKYFLKVVPEMTGWEPTS